ncbi:MAG TPA: Gfo/Idh/MocA family oxidoreductase [Bryobacteraceae bacterium]|jgi:predicted dehydrogenase|nr:Gfo/Idh/MocA family oxidoreductase [Bryobacteraceae bacterium]
MKNGNIQLALIGAGGMGQGDAAGFLSLGGIKLVAVSDIYDGRLEGAKEKWGSDLFATRDYREVLARPDVDAVVIATPDHWHSRITIDALHAGKDVYCEKPMVHSIGEGKQVIEAQEKSGKILQIGSQYASSLAYQKARDLLAQGAIGELNSVEAWLNRNTAIGAWQYSIPPDAAPERIDWDRFLGSAPKHPFEPVRLFRWRNYQDYGTGVAGDLFVHLLTGLHFATGSKGPSRVFATGGLRFWKDGRDVPDVMLALLDYPGFNARLKVNFASGEAAESFGVQFIGSEGTITVSFATLTLSRRPRETEPGYTIDTFPEAVQKEFLAEYHKKYPPQAFSAASMRPEKDQVFEARGVDAHQEHYRNFQKALLTRKPFFEDGVFGFRAAGPALLTNVSYFERRECRWDPEKMEAL